MLSMILIIFLAICWVFFWGIEIILFSYLKLRNKIKSGENELANALINKTTAPYCSGFLLPFLSEIFPEKNDPMKYPTNTTLMSKLSW